MDANSSGKSSNLRDDDGRETREHSDCHLPCLEQHGRKGLEGPIPCLEVQASKTPRFEAAPMAPMLGDARSLIHSSILPSTVDTLCHAVTHPPCARPRLRIDRFSRGWRIVMCGARPTIAVRLLRLALRGCSMDGWTGEHEALAASPPTLVLSSMHSPTSKAFLR